MRAHIDTDYKAFVVKKYLVVKFPLCYKTICQHIIQQVFYNAAEGHT